GGVAPTNESDHATATLAACSRSETSANGRFASLPESTPPPLVGRSTTPIVESARASSSRATASDGTSPTSTPSAPRARASRANERAHFRRERGQPLARETDGRASLREHPAREAPRDDRGPRAVPLERAEDVSPERAPEPLVLERVSGRGRPEVALPEDAQT